MRLFEMYHTLKHLKSEELSLAALTLTVRGFRDAIQVIPELMLTPTHTKGEFGGYVDSRHRTIAVLNPKRAQPAAFKAEIEAEIKRINHMLAAKNKKEWITPVHRDNAVIRAFLEIAEKQHDSIQRVIISMPSNWNEIEYYTADVTILFVMKPVKFPPLAVQQQTSYQ